jgi:2-dehydropantoate 2-reductase
MAGADTVLIARGAHLAVINDQGLRYQTPFIDERLRIPAVSHPGDIELRPDDVFVLTCKSQHTDGALNDLRAAHGSNVPVVCCQNGVVNERMALRRFDNVYAMLVYLPAQLIEPGQIQCHAKLKSGVLDVGLFPTGTDDRTSEISERLEAVNFGCRPDPSVMRYKYAKLITNLTNAIDAVMPSGDGVKPIREAAKAEGRACVSAAGIDCASEEEVKNRRKGVLESGEIPGVERAGSSSRQSLLRGTGDIEADFLNGEIVQLGRLHGIATPVNSVLQSLAVGLAQRKAPPGSVSIEEVTRLIQEQ